MNAAHFVFGSLGGMALTLVALAIYNYLLRPKRKHMRDYYDAYYDHCADCKVPE